MKIVTIVEPNSKGQIVIPKAIRDELGITSDTPLNMIKRGGGIYLYPISDVVLKLEEIDSYTDLLRKTQGAWGEVAWKDYQKRRRLEKKIAKRKREEW